MQINKSQFKSIFTVAALYAVIALFFFIFNPQGLNFSDGNSSGKYVDRVDSYSEYIVRNTIKRNILVQEDKSIFPIVTKGYADSDYNFYADGYEKYLSNLSLQTLPATLIAKLANFNTEKKLDSFFGLLRLANAFLFALLLSAFLFYFSQVQQLKHHFLIPFLVGSSTGFVFFSQNLYFASSLMLIPAVFIAHQLSKHRKFSKIMVFVFGFIFFLRGYEFATIFAILTGFSAAFFTMASWKERLKSFAIAFCLICAAFVFAVASHIALVSADNGWTLSASEATKQAFAKVQLRTASIKNVPVPLGPSFVDEMNKRWSSTAFSIDQTGLKISELDVLLFIMLVFVVRLKSMSQVEKLIIAYGVFGYLSWYIFAYQHIMWHRMYEWYIFSLTMGLAFSMLMILYLNKAAEFIVNRFKQGF